MSEERIVDQEYIQQDFTKSLPAKAHYDSCIFRNCNFQETDLSYYTFSECQFINCNLSNIKVNNTSFKDVKFENCKMLGIRFCDCKPFLLSLEFDSCHLDYASFFQLDIPKTIFLKCSLKEVDFMETKMKEAKLLQSDMSRAVFDNTTIEKADFRGSTNYQINPKTNNLKKAQFSMPDVIGLLSHLDIKIN